MKKRRERYSRILSDAKNAHERCEYDEFKDDIRDVDIYNLVYKIKRWHDLTYDKNRKAFMTITKRQFDSAKEKNDVIKDLFESWCINKHDGIYKKP